MDSSSEKQSDTKQPTDVTYEDVIALLAPIKKENEELRQRNKSLQHQLDWFKRKMFGSKSEKQLEPNPY